MNTKLDIDNLFNAFYPADNNDGTYRIECRCIIYRAMLGKHPNWAKPQGNAKDGFYTKYYLLIEDNITSLATAQKKVDDLNKKIQRYPDQMRRHRRLDSLSIYR